MFSKNSLGVNSGCFYSFYFKLGRLDCFLCFKPGPGLVRQVSYKNISKLIKFLYYLQPKHLIVKKNSHFLEKNCYFFDIFTVYLYRQICNTFERTISNIHSYDACDFFEAVFKIY